jgi:diguanylate cyclase (GGDEF)-like protein
LAAETISEPRGWRRSALARWARHGLLSRVRAFFLLNALINTASAAVQLVFQSQQAPWLRTCGTAALLCLAVWWVRGWRRHSFPAAVEPVEWLVPVLVAIALGRGADALGVFYGALMFRALYGNPRAAVTRVVIVGVVLPAMPLMVMASGRPDYVGEELIQLPTVLVLAGITYLLGTALGRQERAVAREKVLTQTGTVLTTTDDVQAIHQGAVDAALTLLGRPDGAHAVLGLRVGSQHEIVAAAGDGIEGMVGARPTVSAIPVAVREAFDTGRPAKMDHVTFADPGMLGFTPKTGGVLLLPLRTKDGVIGELVVASDRSIPAEVQGSLETLSNQVALGLESAKLNEELTWRAFYDSLTGLANRELLHDRLDHAVARTRRTGEPCGLLLIDMDGFKLINDSLGHGVGDDLLVGVTKRMRGCVREVDTIGRIGGDEFAIVLQDLADRAGAVAVANRVVESLRAPIVVSGHHVTARVSIGIAMVGDSDEGEQISSEALLRNADLAMYHAKARRTGSWEMYEPGMHAEAVNRRSLEADLHHALPRDELLIHFQPIHALETGILTGVEALVRWQHPSRGLIPPAEFIPLAEKTGLIGPIGDWVLWQACQQVAAWQRDLPVGRTLELSVNLSPVQLDQPDLAERIGAALRASGLAPHLLLLELTEGVLVRDVDSVTAMLDRLKSLGVRLAIDDFGTGFSSLGYLQRLPIDILKIDRSFVDRLGAGGEQMPLADAIVRLGQTLRMETIAEGIETDEQLVALRSLGCQYGQGYLFGRPGDPDTIGALLHRTPAASVSCGDAHPAPIARAA